jgi:hypothetical protein
MSASEVVSLKEQRRAMGILPKKRSTRRPGPPGAARTTAPNLLRPFGARRSPPASPGQAGNAMVLPAAHRRSLRRPDRPTVAGAVATRMGHHGAAKGDEADCGDDIPLLQRPRPPANFCKKTRPRRKYLSTRAYRVGEPDLRRVIGAPNDSPGGFESPDVHRFRVIRLELRLKALRHAKAECTRQVSLANVLSPKGNTGARSGRSAHRTPLAVVTTRQPAILCVR